MLAKSNKEREAWIAEQNEKGVKEEGVVERIEGGEVIKERVDLAMLDCSDREN